MPVFCVTRPFPGQDILVASSSGTKEYLEFDIADISKGLSDMFFPMQLERLGKRWYTFVEQNIVPFLSCEGGRK